MRIGAALLLLLTGLGCSGCLVIGATVAAVGAVAVTTVKTASKVTVATVETTGRVAAAAVTSSGEMTALSVETATRLAKTGMVVVVDPASGTTTELPWQPGLSVGAIARGRKQGGNFNAAKIFRGGKVVKVDLKARTAEPNLHAGDVVELQR